MGTGIVGRRPILEDWDWTKGQASGDYWVDDVEVNALGRDCCSLLGNGHGDSSYKDQDNGFG